MTEEKYTNYILFLFFFQAVLIDMEEGVVNEILQGPLRDVFDSKQLITDISGSGNNWWENAEHKN